MTTLNDRSDSKISFKKKTCHQYLVVKCIIYLSTFKIL